MFDVMEYFVSGPVTLEEATIVLHVMEKFVSGTFTLVEGFFPGAVTLEVTTCFCMSCKNLLPKPLR